MFNVFLRFRCFVFSLLYRFLDLFGWFTVLSGFNVLLAFMLFGLLFNFHLVIINGFSRWFFRLIVLLLDRVRQATSDDFVSGNVFLRFFFSFYLYFWLYINRFSFIMLLNDDRPDDGADTMVIFLLHVLEWPVPLSGIIRKLFTIKEVDFFIVFLQSFIYCLVCNSSILLLVLFADVLVVSVVLKLLFGTCVFAGLTRFLFVKFMFLRFLFILFLLFKGVLHFLIFGRFYFRFSGVSSGNLRFVNGIFLCFWRGGRLEFCWRFNRCFFLLDSNWFFLHLGFFLDGFFLFLLQLLFLSIRMRA